MLSDRLRMARKKSGLSLRALAAAMNPPVSAQAIGKYEAGEMMPSSRVLVGLGQALGVSLDFLMSSQIVELSGMEFRRRSGTSARDRAQVEAVVTEKLENYLAVEDILELPAAPDPFGALKTDRLTLPEEAEMLAEQLRDAWDLGGDAIPSMTALLEDKGIKVIEVDLPERVSGMTCEVQRPGGKPDISVIVVSSRVNIERRRFTLAHELGHRVIAGVTSGELKLEKAIDRFAGAFLVPANHLRREIGEHRHNVAYQEIKRLKHLYGVAATAMLVRLGQTGILSEGTVTYAFQTFARAWRSQEPAPMDANTGLGAFEKPRRFERLVYRALAEQMISPVRAAELMHRPLAEIELGLKGPSLS